MVFLLGDLPPPAPVLFAQGAVSHPATSQWEFALTPDGERLFYATQDEDGRRLIVEQKRAEGAWTPPLPVAAITHPESGGPSLSEDGRTLFFGARGAEDRLRDLFALDLEAPDAEPVRITTTDTVGEIDVTLDREGLGYLWTDRRYDGAPGIGFYRVRYADGTLKVLADASGLHADDLSGENGPYVDPFGRYLLFANDSVDPAGGGEDLFISLLVDGTAQAPRPLGPIVNTPYNEGAPQVSADGEWLYFTSDRPHPGGMAGDSQIWTIPTSAVPALAAVTGGAALTPRGPVRSASGLEERGGRLFDPETGELFTGVVAEAYSSGARKLRRGVRNGLAHGAWLEWHENGVPRLYAEWKDGVGDGVWVYFGEDGEVTERAHVQRDVWQGPAEGWGPAGEKAFEAVYHRGEKTADWSADREAD